MKETTNRSLCQHFRKGTSPVGYSPTDLDAMAAKLDTRPRKAPYYTTPADTLNNTMSAALAP